MSDRHNAQEVHEPTGAPEVLELTAAALRRDLRALDILARALELPADEQQAAFIDGLAEYAQEVQDRTGGEQLAFSLPDYNAALDPAGGAFDPAAYRQAIDDAGGWQSFKEDLQDALRDEYGETMKRIAKAGEAAATAAMRTSAGAAAALANNPGMIAGKVAAQKSAAALAHNTKFKTAARAVQVVRKALLDALNSPEFQERLKEVQEIADETEKISTLYEPYFIEAWPKFAEAPDFIKDVAYSLILELDIAQEAGQFEGVTVPEVLDAGYNSEWEKIEGSPFFDLLTVAERGAALFPTLDRLQALQKALEKAGKSKEDADLIRAGQLTFEGLKHPMDKLTETLLQADSYDDAGQLAGKITRMGGNVPDVKLIMSIDDELRALVDKPLTYRRALVLSAWYNLLLAGATSWTIDDIIKWTGKENINASDRKAFRNEIDILAATNLRAEQEGFGSGKNEKPRFATGGRLLAFTYIETDAKGAAGGGLRYYPYKPPKEEAGGPLLTFAERLGQVTYYPAAVLKTPSTKNETAYKREDYFRNRIAHFRNATPKEQKKPEFSKIKYRTYFEKFGITDSTKIKREKKYIESLLDYFTEINWIGGYAKSRDAITLQPPKPGGLKALEDHKAKKKKTPKK